MEDIKSNKWQLSIPSLNIQIDLRKYLVALVSTITLCAGLYIIYIITKEDASLKDFLRFQISTLPWSLVTSLVIHNHDAHIQGNALGLVVFFPIFLYSTGIRKGFIFLLLFGVGGHIFELIFSIPVNIGLYFYFAVLRQQDLTRVPFGLYSLLPPSGAGISGAVCGVYVYLSLDLYLAIRDFCHEKKDRWLLFLYSIPIGLFIIFLERTIEDLRSFFFILYSNWFWHLSDDLLAKGVIFVSGLIGTDFSSVGLFLSHFFRGMCGFLVYFRKSIFNNLQSFVLRLRKED